MKPREIRERTDEDIKEKVTQLGEKLRVLKFGLAAGKVKNVREIRGVKKDIARILTELRSRSFEKK